MFSFKRKVGNKVEDYALNYLEKQKLTLLERNYLTKLGEIDLVMLDDNEVVFVEVRYRKQQTYGGALASVDKRKQKKLMNTAELFLIKHPEYQHLNCRFDVIAVKDTLKCNPICWVKGAFQR